MRISNEVAHAMDVVGLTDVVIAARLDYDYADFIGENDWLENIILRLIMDKKLDRKAFIAAVYEHDPSIFDDGDNEPYIVQIMLTFAYYLEHFEAAYQLVKKRMPRVTKVKKEPRLNAQTTGKKKKKKKKPAAAKPTTDSTGSTSTNEPGDIDGDAVDAKLAHNRAELFRALYGSRDRSAAADTAMQLKLTTAFTGRTIGDAAHYLKTEYEVQVGGPQAREWAITFGIDPKAAKAAGTTDDDEGATTGSTGTAGKSTTPSADSASSYEPGEVDGGEIDGSLKHSSAAAFRQLYGGDERSDESDEAMQQKLIIAFTGRTIVDAAHYITTTFNVRVSTAQAKKWAITFGIDPAEAKAAGKSDADDDDNTGSSPDDPGSTPAVDDDKSDLLVKPRAGSTVAKVVAEIGDTRASAISALKKAGSVPELAKTLKTDVTNQNMRYILKDVYGIKSTRAAIAGDLDDDTGKSGGSGGSDSKPPTSPAGGSGGGMGLSAELGGNNAVAVAHVQPLITYAAEVGAGSLSAIFATLESGGGTVGAAKKLHEMGVIPMDLEGHYIQYKDSVGC